MRLPMSTCSTTNYRLYYLNATTLRRVFAIANPSVVCLYVTLVHPTQGVEAFGNISSSLCTLAIL